MESSTSNFIELKWNELSDKLSDLAKVHGDIKLWKKNEAPDLCKVVNSHTEDEDGCFTQQLRLLHHSKSPVNKSWMNKDFFIQFELLSVEYFAKGQIVEVFENGEFWLEMNPHVFRVEKRENERLTTFPQYQAYAYFKINKSSNENNLVFINKHIEENHRVFQKFNRLTQREILEAQDSMDTDKNDEVIGFRILDVSGSGVSFLANKTEALYFTDKSVFELSVVIDGDVFHVSNAKVIYNVDYVNPRAGSVPMYKIGLNFDEDKHLYDFVQSHIKKDHDENKILKDFEKFSD